MKNITIAELLTQIKVVYNRMQHLDKDSLQTSFTQEPITNTYGTNAHNTN